MVHRTVERFYCPDWMPVDYFLPRWVWQMTFRVFSSSGDEAEEVRYQILEQYYRGSRDTHRQLCNLCIKFVINADFTSLLS
jgi:hypothetical protein